MSQNNFKKNHGNVIFLGLLHFYVLVFFLHKSFTTYIFINTCLVTTNNYNYLDFCQLKVINHESTCKPSRKFTIGTHIKYPIYNCNILCLN